MKKLALLFIGFTFTLAVTAQEEGNSDGASNKEVDNSVKGSQVSDPESRPNSPSLGNGDVDSRPVLGPGQTGILRKAANPIEGTLEVNPGARAGKASK